MALPLLTITIVTTTTLTKKILHKRLLLVPAENASVDALVVDLCFWREKGKGTGKLRYKLKRARDEELMSDVFEFQNKRFTLGSVCFVVKYFPL